MQESTELNVYREHIKSFIARIALEYSIPGIALEMTANNQQISVAVGTLGVSSPAPISSAAQFEIGGLSKVLLAIVALQLSAANRLDIRAPIAKYLPELASSAVGQQVCVWHLLCHAGGYRSTGLIDINVRENYSWQKLVEFLNDTTLMFTPGSVFSYSLTGPVIIAEIIKRQTGFSALQVVRKMILEKLQLSNSTGIADSARPTLELHTVDPANRKWIKAPTLKLCDLWSSSLFDISMTLSDINRLIHGVTASREGNPENALVSAHTAMLLQNQFVQLPFTSGGPRADTLPMSVGMGCAVYRPHWLGLANDSRTPNAFLYHDSQDAVISIAMNVHRPYVQALIFDELLRSLTNDEDTKAEDNSPKFDVGELVGTYSGSSGGSVSVTRQGTQLVCEIDSGTGIRKLKVLMLQDEMQRWIVRSDAGPWRIGFFRDPTSGVPCLMAGPTAYRQSVKMH